MQKNVAGQKWIVFAFQGEAGTNPGNPVTGDAANITANLRLDGGAANAVDDVNPTELEDGYYAFDLTQAETNADLILIAPASGTANVIVIGVPGALYTTHSGFPDSVSQTGDSFARLGAPAGASVSADIATVDTVVDGIQADLSNGTDGLGAIKSDTASILVDTAEIGAAGAGLTNLGGMSTGMKAEVNTEVLDVLSVDTFTEPGQGAPTATPTIRQMLHYLYKSWRNKKDNDGTETKLYANDETTVDHKQSTTASGGTVTKGEWGTGP